MYHSRIKRTFILCLLCFLTVISSMETVFAHDAFYMMSTLDTSGLRYSTVVLQDNEEHREAALGKFFEQAGDWKFTNSNFVDVKAHSVNGSNSQTAITERVEAWKKLVPPMSSFLFLDFPDTKQLVYTFPSVHSDVDKVLFDGGNEDRVQAEQIADTLTTSLNDCISYIIKESEYNPNAQGNLTPVEWLMDIGQQLSVKGSSAAQGNNANLSVNGVTFTLKPYKEEMIGITPLKDLEGNYNYLELSNDKNNRTVIAQFKMPKGYYARTSSPSEEEYQYQPLLKNVPKDFLEPIRNSDVSHLSWGHIVLEASYLYDVHSISAARMDDQYKPNMFEQYLVETSSGFLDSLQSKLGLYSFQELILNRGTRNSTYFYGIFPKSFYGSVMLLYVICLIIAVILLMTAIVKMVFTRSLAAISVNKKVSLMESFKDFVITLLILFLALPIMTSAFKLNYDLIVVLNRASDNIHYFGSLGKMSSGLLSGIVILLVELVMRIYINFVYIYRSILSGILLGTAPLFICSVAFGGKYKILFSTWLKELVATVALQPIHALFLIFFSSLLASSATRVIENIVLMIAFIPLTKYFKEAMLGLPEGGGDGIVKGMTTSSIAMGAGVLFGAGKLVSSYMADKISSGSSAISNQSSSSSATDSHSGVSRDITPSIHRASPLFHSKGATPATMETQRSAEELKSTIGDFISNPSKEQFKEVGSAASTLKGNIVKDDVTKSQMKNIAAVTGLAVGKTILQAGKTAAMAGAALGTAAVGDNFHAMRFGMMTGEGAVQTGRGIGNIGKILTNNGQGFSRVFNGNYDEKALTEANAATSSDFSYTPENLGNRGVTDFIYNEDTGATEVTQSLSGLAYSQGIVSILNPTKRTIGFEYPEEIYQNSNHLQSLYSAYTDESKGDLKERFKKDGIFDVRKSANGVVIEFEKEKFGLDYAKTNSKLGVVQYAARNGYSPTLPHFAYDVSSVNYDKDSKEVFQNEIYIPMDNTIPQREESKIREENPFQ